MGGGGVVLKFAKGGPYPLANMDSRWSISAGGFGPGGTQYPHITSTSFICMTISTYSIAKA